MSYFYLAAVGSPRNQPTASDFIGSSDGTAICSTRSHSEQSNLLSSNPVGPARCAHVSCARGILGSGVAELRTLGLRLGNLSLHSTLLRAGAQHSQSPVKAEEGR